MNYLKMVNEVLVRMREREVTSVSDTDNDPQQKIVCKFVQDAHDFVKGAHTWNAQRRVWTIVLDEGVSRYALPDSGQSATIYMVRYAESDQTLDEVDARYLGTRKHVEGKPEVYSHAFIDDGNMAVQVHPAPDSRYKADGTVTIASEWSESEYQIAEFNGELVSDTSTSMAFFGYTSGPFIEADDDDLGIPNMAVMYYALAYASRERGELGGQSTGELFQLAASHLSDAVAWDVNNSANEYIWSPK